MFLGWHEGRFVHVPIALGTASTKKVDPGGQIWRRVLAVTGQPSSMV
jgi:hypothetical protein